MPRKNAAYLLPSDFVLLRIDKGKKSFVLSKLRSHEKVKSVTAQLEVEGALLSASVPLKSDVEGVVVPLKLNAHALWKEGYTGKGVKVAIFDTGLSRRTYYVNNVVERKDWTTENTLEDGVGHGTFVAGMVAGTNPSCMGMAPDSELYIYRVFTSRRVSFTAW